MTRVTYRQAPGIDDVGKYVVEIERVDYEEFRPSRKSPSAQRIMWTLVVTEGDRAGERIYHETPLADDLLLVLKRTLSAVGVETDGSWSFEYEDGGSLIIEPALAGRKASAIIKEVRGFKRVVLAPVS